MSAVHRPKESFEFIGIDSQADRTPEAVVDHTAAERRNSVVPFIADPYGCALS